MTFSVIYYVYHETLNYACKRQLVHRGHLFKLFTDPEDQPHSSDVGKFEFPRSILPIPR